MNPTDFLQFSRRTPLRGPRATVFAVIVSSLLLLGQSASYAQTGPISGEGPRGYGQTGRSGSIDTAGRDEQRRRIEGTAGLLEQPIDPQTYRVGPNDVMSVTIWTTRTLQFDVYITPDAKVLIETVGEVDVRGLTLAEAEAKVKRAVSNVYRVESSVSLRRMREFKVNVIGAIRFPGSIVATPVTRVSEVVDLAGGVLDRGDKRNIILKRRNAAGVFTEQRIDLLPFYASGDLTANPFVSDGDVLQVKILDDMAIVQIYGEVVAPGEFTWNPNDSISTLLRAAYGLTTEAMRDSIEVVSVDERGNIVEQTWHSVLDDGTVTGDRLLRIGDRILVRPKERFLRRSQVAIDGEVVKPGIYVITPGRTRITDVISSSGGVTSDASLADATLIRESAKNQQDEYFAYVSSIEPENQSPEESEYLRTKLLESKQSGVMTVDFEALLAGDESQNLFLESADSIYIPKRVHFIRISGKVKNPGNLMYMPGMTYRDYIAQSGGYGWRADDDETQVIKARTGDRVPADDEDDYMLEPGDAIFVPEERPSNFWEGLATALTIVSQALTIIVVVNSLRPQDSAP